MILALLAVNSLIVNLFPGQFLGQFIQMICSLLLTLISYSKVKKEYYDKKIVALIWLFFISICLSTYYVRIDHVLPVEGLSSPFTPILFVFQLLGWYYFAIYLRYKEDTYYFRKVFLVISVYIIIMDMFVFIEPRNEDPDKYFLFMNKFDLSYFHLLWLTTFLIYKQITPLQLRRERLFFLILFVSFASTYWSGCSTGSICIFLILCFILLELGFNLFFKHKYWLFYTIFVVDFLFLTSYILVMDTPLVKYIIVDLLNKDVSLTGRVYIYSCIENIVNNRPLWGFGPRNATYAMGQFLNMPNAQNGLIQMYIDVGLIGLTFYSLILLRCLRQINMSIPCYYLFIFIFIMVITSMVEITIDNKFLCYTLLFYAFNIDSYENNKLQIRTW